MVNMILRGDLPYKFAVLQGDLASLPKTWPSQLLKPFDAYKGGKKFHLNQSHAEFHEFVAADAEWSGILDQENLLKAGTTLARFVNAGLDIKFSRAKVEFSSLFAGGGLLPHPDGAEKFMTAIYFMPSTGYPWHPTWGGGFSICRHRENPNGDFAGQYVPWLDVDELVNVEYIPGNVAVFVRTPSSLHGVREVRCPPGFSRNSLTINWIR